MSEGIDLLTTGLGEGYAGKTEINSVDRGGFTLKSSSYNGDKGRYIDQWLNARIGAGQELAITPEEEMFTRIYAGGVIAPEKLQALGLTEKEVIGYLIKKVGELASATRLYDDCIPEADENWQYAYRITDRIPEVELTSALETIHYNNNLVFAHMFGICQVIPTEE